MAIKNQKSLSPKEISLIISSCESAKVRVLKYAGLYLEFDRNVILASKKDQELTPESEAPAENVTSLTVAEITDTQKNESQRSILRDEISLKDDQLGEMWITDPYQAEQLEINSQLEESDGGTQIET